MPIPRKSKITVYWSEKEVDKAIIHLLKDLHAFNKLDAITVNLISHTFKVNATQMCKDNGIVYNI